MSVKYTINDSLLQKVNGSKGNFGTKLELGFQFVPRYFQSEVRSTKVLTYFMLHPMGFNPIFFRFNGMQ